MVVVSLAPAFLRAFAWARGVEVDLGTELGPTYLHIGYMYHTYKLVGGFNPSETYSSVGMIIPNIYGKNVHHEPGIVHKLKINHTPI